jgi:chromosome segregation ATPase
MPAASTISLLGTPAETIRFYLQQRYLTESAKAFLAQLIATQGEIGRLRQREAELAAERTRITEDETRTRQNLGVLRVEAAELELRKKYLAQLEKSETRLEQIRDEAKQAAASRQQLETELGKKVQEFRDE